MFDISFIINVLRNKNKLIYIFILRKLNKPDSSILRELFEVDFLRNIYKNKLP